MKVHLLPVTLKLDHAACAIAVSVRHDAVLVEPLQQANPCRAHGPWRRVPSDRAKLRRVGPELQ